MNTQDQPGRLELLHAVATMLAAGSAFMQVLLAADSMAERVSAGMLALLAMRLGRLAVGAVAADRPLKVGTLSKLGALAGTSGLAVGLIDTNMLTIWTLSFSSILAGMAMAIGMIVTRTASSHLSSPEVTTSFTTIAWAVGAAIPVALDYDHLWVKCSLLTLIATLGLGPTLRSLPSDKIESASATRKAIENDGATGQIKTGLNVKLFILYSGLSAGLATITNAYILPVFRHELGADRMEITRVSDKVQLKGVCESVSYGPKGFMIQKFVNIRADIRVFYSEGEILCSLWRIPADKDSLGNISQGARAEVREGIPDELKSSVLAIAETVQASYLCIDFLYDGEEYFFGEIETGGGFSGLDESHQLQVAKAFFGAMS